MNTLIQNSLLLSLCLLIVSCSNQTKEHSKQQTTKAKPAKVQENYIDFNYSKIVAFASVSEQDFSLLFKNNRLKKFSPFDTTSVQLNKSQIDILNAVLSGNFEYANPDSLKSPNSADCFLPRHNIIFLDDTDSIIHYISICFECGNIKWSKPLNTTMLNLRLFLTAIKLPVFDRVSMIDPHFEYYYELNQKKKKRLKTSK